MLAYIKGKVAYKTGEWAIIEVGGVGYKLTMPAGALTGIGNIGSEVQVFTHLHVREDMLNLYGFQNEDELNFFEILLQVSGIGPKGAIAILGAFPLGVLQSAILEENTVMLARAPGIGKKTAQRIVLELKDKVKKIAVDFSPRDKETKVPGSRIDDAVAALVSLGYSVQEANYTLSLALQELGDQATTETLIKLGLKQLTQKKEIL